jgi:hypothetical protein
MVPTLLNIAVGVLIAVALLGAAFDRRSVLLVAGAAALPDLDAAFGTITPGGPNAVLHSLFVAGGLTALLYFDTMVRDESWLGSQYGWYGVRVAWVALAAFVVAGIGLDVFSTEGVALLYPFSDRYYAIVGRFVLSTQDGIVQTYVTIGDGWLQVTSPGTVGTHTVESPLVATAGDRRIRLVDSGWQAVILVTAIVALPAKRLVERRERSREGDA